jgi:hypothetical protein
MRALISGLMALLPIGSAMAESIPAAVLEKDRQACVAGRVGNQRVETNCLCYVLSLSRDLTFQQYLTVEGEIKGRVAQGQSIQVATRGVPEIVTAMRSCGLSQ